jgi:hypothetical protein
MVLPDEACGTRANSRVSILSSSLAMHRSHPDNDFPHIIIDLDDFAEGRHRRHHIL